MGSLTAVELGLLQYQRSSEIANLLLATEECTAQAQNRLLCFLNESPVLSIAPLRKDYTRKVLKAVITGCEQRSVALSDELVEMYTDTIVAPEEPSAWCHKTFFYCPVTLWQSLHCTPSDVVSRHVSMHLQAPYPAQPGLFQPKPSVAPCGGEGDNSSMGLVSIRVSDNMLAGGTGCHPWEAGFMLAEYVLSTPDLFRGKKCLELGCGAGLVGVCLHHVGAATGSGGILLSDADPEAISNCCFNLSVNGVPTTLIEGPPNPSECFDQGKVSVCKLDWTDGAQGLAPDVVLGSDVLYDPEVVPILVKLLQSILVASASRHRSQDQGPEDAALPEASGSNPQWKSTGAVTEGTCKVILAAKKRNEQTLEMFVQQSEANGLLLSNISKEGWNAGIQFACNTCLRDRHDVLLYMLTLA